MRKFLLLFSGAFIFIPAAAQLNGTYSVNQSSPATATNYQSVTAAIQDLSTGVRPDGGPVNGPGVSGPVTIRLAAGSGPYTEQITIPAIAGVSAVNTLRITGGPTRETITFGATTQTQRHVIKINGARHITIDSLDVVNTNATYANGIQITNSADSNVVSNCTVTINSTSTSQDFSCITITGLTVTNNGDHGDDNLILNNTVSGGYFGISMRGVSSTVFNHRNKVIGNTVSNYYFHGIYCYQQDSTLVIGNTISARPGAAVAGYGIYLYYADLFRVESNHLNSIAGTGIYGSSANYQNNSGTARARIVNNMIGGTWQSGGSGMVFVGNSRNIDIWHNSVCITGVTGGNGLMTSAASGLDIRNNSFALFGSSTGYALNTSPSAVIAIDHNNYHAPGSSNFVFIGAAYNTSTYVGGGGFNFNSRNGDPMYVNNAGDLHTSALQLSNGAAAVSVTTDIDGDPRPMAPSLVSDIGADEYTHVMNDAGVVAATSPATPFGAGVQNITVVLHDFGQLTLTSATVNWDVNLVPQAPFAWTGSVPSTLNSAPVTIGTYNFGPATTYNIRVWTSNPNGVTDENFLNDTLYLTICTALNGVYTVGGAGADFPSLNTAVDALLCGGVAGPVTFNLTQGAGPFNEQIIIPPVAGASAANTIRFNGGANRETVQYTATTTSERAVIKLNGADHIILDSLTIINNGTTYGYGVQLTANADYNVVRSCNVQVNASATSNSFAGITLSAALITTLANNGDENIIENNTVNGGYYGISMQGPNSPFDQHNIVRSNSIYNAYAYGIYCSNQNLTEVTGNRISLRNPNLSISYGIYMHTVDRFAIESNDLDSLGGAGIYTNHGNYQGGTGSTRARIVNNMIGGTWSGTSPYGIQLMTNSRNIDVWHNSVSLTNGNGRCLSITGGSGHDVQNNSFAVYGSTSGWAAYINNPSEVAAFDYNNYYASGSANFIYIGTAYTPATFVGGGGWNNSSINSNPNYTNPAHDLHAMSVALYDAGVNLGVNTDIDGDARPAVPSAGYDIGADEFSPSSIDNDVVQIISPSNNMCADSNTVLEAVIFNNGLTTITTVPVTAQITGAVSATLNATYTGNLASGQSDTLVVGTFNSHPGGLLNIVVYSSLIGDQNVTNDTASLQVMIQPLAAPAVGNNINACIGSTAVLTVTTDGFLHEWYDAASGGNFLGAGDSYTTPPVTSTTTYYVQSSHNVYGCPNPVLTPVTVTAVPLPVVSLGNDTTVCGSIVLDAGHPSLSWLWSTTSATQQITVTTSGQYSVAVSDSNCTGHDTIVITVSDPVVTLSLPLDTACLNGGSISLGGESPMGGTWSGPGVTGSSFDPMAAGIGTWAITYDYTDANGCSNSAIDSIMVDPCLSVDPVATPAAFTLFPNPNNGMFTLQLNGSGEMQITVYNATGQLVSAERRTAGTYTMQVQAKGVYLLVVEHENGMRTRQTFTVQ